MFRGIDMATVRTLILAVVCVVVGMTLSQMGVGQSGSPPPVRGTATTHRPGELTAPQPQAAIPPVTARPTPAPPTPTPTPSALQPGATLDLNLADEQELMLLPGIGEKRARDIIADRTANGPFRSVEELDRVQGFGKASVSRLAPYLTVNGRAALPAEAQAPIAPDAPVRINVARIAELETLNGVGPAMAARIVADRERRGAFRNANDLLRVKGIGPAFIEKNHHRLRFD